VHKYKVKHYYSTGIGYQDCIRLVFPLWTGDSLLTCLPDGPTWPKAPQSLIASQQMSFSNYHAAVKCLPSTAAYSNNGLAGCVSCVVICVASSQSFLTA
jgi:hypothetical protein